MQTLPTWDHRSTFRYTGSVKDGITIKYGNGFRFTKHVSAQKLQDLFDFFKGRTAKIGTSRTAQPAGSVGQWLQANVTKTAIASYLGPIFIKENYATKVGKSEISFMSKR